jgi:two-component system OmpR family sensor kinase
VLSFRRRLALAHGAAIVIVLALAALGGYWGLSKAVHGQLDAALLALAETEIGMLAEDADKPAVVHEAPHGAAAPSFVRLDRLIQIIDADGQVLARSSNLGEAQLPTPGTLMARLAAGETVFETLTGFGEEPTRIVSVPVAGRTPWRAVQVAGSLDDTNQVMQSAGLLFVLLGIALFVALGTAGASLTNRVLRAIDDVVQHAQRIGDAHLGERLTHPGTRDEIGRLVDTLNEMLGRLETSFEAQRRFTADASHELRSPLSRLRTEIELALRRPRDAAAYEATLRSCMEEAERLTLLVEELLALARLDAGQERGPAETVCLNELMQEAAQRSEPTARERDVAIAIEASPVVNARVARGAASLVLANLLDNALKFSPPGSRVRLAATEQGAHALLSVSDTGPGLQRDELDRVFERFYRGSAARAGGAPGVGLGLALSQAIVQAHGGGIDAASPPGGGAVFTIRLPLAIDRPMFGDEQTAG